MTKKTYAAKLPFPVSELQLYFYKYEIIKQLEVLKFTDDDDVTHTAKEIYTCLASKLGNNRYFFGVNPSSLDAVVFGHLAVQYFAPMPDQTLRNTLQQFPSLVKFIETTAAELFGEIPDIQAETVNIALVSIFINYIIIFIHLTSLNQPGEETNWRNMELYCCKRWSRNINVAFCKLTK